MYPFRIYYRFRDPSATQHCSMFETYADLVDFAHFRGITRDTHSCHVYAYGTLILSWR